MMDSEIKAQRRMGRKLTHRAAQLRKMADELDALAAELDRADAAESAERPGTPDGQGAETDGHLAI